MDDKPTDKTIKEVLGYFGNIWVKSHILEKAGDSNGEGHLHHFDHVTLVIKGSLKVEVDDGPSKTFVAPTFITIKKQTKHKITALEDNTVFYCVFAIRDINGEVGDIVDEDNTPYYSGLLGTRPLTPPEQKEDLEWLKGNTIIEVIGN